MAADDGEGVEDVGGVVFGEAVEVEVEGVEAGAQVAAFFFVPDEGGAVVAEVAGEGGHVVGGVGEAEDVVTDEGAGGGGAEGAVVVGRGDDGAPGKAGATIQENMAHKDQKTTSKLKYNQGRLQTRNRGNGYA